MQTDCIFCKLAAKEIPVQAIYEDEHVIAFPDINPAAPTHVLIIPKQHVANLLEVSPESPLMAQLMGVIPRIAAQLGLAEEGFRVVINTKEHAGQTVHHLHLHLLGGRIMTWPPG
ncbi:histidine triad nucleotide-binding protein [Anaerosporomusa subterranea]|uniref:Histidine triad nucleotide-binding protein n=1 Tax=Anaerosporomusa subterranea TaxID=1794912 RepID=A0A154BSX0_ANASB|nr:histidine triad nucleotide-binding protein [Anaerosporomusa subterranea]KYZ77019.1 histidine triad nucleotide-binding protein [Anaerosporomusa subterranea]